MGDGQLVLNSASATSSHPLSPSNKTNQNKHFINELIADVFTQKQRHCHYKGFHTELQI